MHLIKPNRDSVRNLETETNLECYVAEIRKVLAENAVDIPDHCDQFIIRCLRVKNYDVAKTTKLLTSFGTALRMNDMQDLFQKFVPSTLKELYFGGVVFPLLKRDEHERLIIVGKSANWNVDTHDFDDVLSAIVMLFNYCNAASSAIQRNGVVFLLDWRGWNFQQLRTIQIRRLKLVAKFMQDSTPGKVKAIHFIYQPRLVKWLFSILKPFLKSKLAKRIHFHGEDLTTMHQCIHPATLPETVEGPIRDSIDENLLNDLMLQDKYNQDMIEFGYPAS